MKVILLFNAGKHVDSILIRGGAFEVLGHFLWCLMHVILYYFRHKFSNIVTQVFLLLFLKYPIWILFISNDEGPKLDELVDEFGDNGRNPLVEFVLLDYEVFA